MIQLGEVFAEISDELVRAEAHHSPIFNSLHEAYAVIAEEVDELWDITRQKQKNRSRNEIHKELIQIAAMAVKALRSMENFGGQPAMTPPTQAQNVIDIYAMLPETWGQHDQ
jgi:chaperonin GroEL (HSP60 family)